MLTPQDDLLGHQTPSTFDQPASSDERWTERYWYSGHPIGTGDLIFDFGLGHYANKNVMDGFAGVTVGGVQHNFRVSRRLHGQPHGVLDPRIGPLRFEVLEGMRTHRITLAPNESGISCDLRFTATTEGAQEVQSFRRRHSRVEEDLARMSQFARWEGWLEVAGTRHTVTPDIWWGQRDHSWGIRSEMRTDVARPPVQQHSKFFWMWCMYQFETFGLCLFVKEHATGNKFYLSGTESPRLGHGGGQTARQRHLVSFEHDLTWAEDPHGQSIATGELHLQFEHGPPRTVQIQMMPGRFYLKGGLYGGYNGWNHGDDRGLVSFEHDLTWAEDPHGQSIATGELHLQFEHGPPRTVQIQMMPGRFYLKGGLYGGYNGWNHGDDRGALYAEHDRWDLADAETRARARTLGDHVTRATCDGQTGWGISEYGVAAGFPRYPGPQAFPAL